MFGGGPFRFVWSIVDAASVDAAAAAAAGAGAAVIVVGVVGVGVVCGCSVIVVAEALGVVSVEVGTEGGATTGGSGFVIVTFSFPSAFVGASFGVLKSETSLQAFVNSF